MRLYDSQQPASFQSLGSQRYKAGHKRNKINIKEFGSVFGKQIKDVEPQKYRECANMTVSIS